MTGSNYTETLLLTELKKARVPADAKDNALLNKSLLCLYRVATCDGKCRGGDHIIEALAGRGFNLASSALVLCSIGYYDEALNLLRSLGELANVLAYLRLHPQDFPNWVLASKKERLSRYSPSAIRKAISAKGVVDVPMDEDMYAELCELATHVTGRTAPNSHGLDDLRHVGGHNQEKGETMVIEELTYLAAQVAMLSADMTGRKELREEVARSISYREDPA